MNIFNGNGDMEKVILVDRQDRVQGTMEKMEAHRAGALHRAFSVFVFNSRRELMLQQRAHHKYHSAGLWSNTCCSHPRPGEDTAAAAHLRLKEEMGFDTPLSEVFDFIYFAELEKDMKEHELDHVLVGYHDGEPRINMDEAASWKWISLPGLDRDILDNPGRYTVWFRIIFERVKEIVSREP